MHTKWEQNVSLVLGAILLVGCGMGAVSFFAGTPSFPPRTPAELLAAEKWIRVLLTLMWVGFGVVTILLMILISAVLVMAEGVLKKRRLSGAKHHGIRGTDNTVKVAPDGVEQAPLDRFGTRD